jgi:phage FluMu protein Com
MPHILLKCTECDEVGEIYCDGDNAMFCPECRSVDCFEEPEEEIA